MKYLNLGCGSRFHADWINVNFTATGEGVIASDLTKGIPFPDKSFEVVYHSHVLEHFHKTEAEFFIKECYRVLRPAGIIRVAVPDLEAIARTYLFSLEKAISGDDEWDRNYQWVLLEMYDQTVRDEPGGEMKNFLYSQNLINREFIVGRCGVEIENIISNSQKQVGISEDAPENNLKRLLKHLYRMLRYADYRRSAITQMVLAPADLHALQIGRFRQSGEIHQWMYDSYSLSMLLKKCELEKIVNRTASTSYIPDWASFDLDTEPNGSIYKPDSLYMEAVKT